MSSWQPTSRSTVAPFLVVRDGDATVAFAETVFGATMLRPPLRRSSGRLWNAELSLGDSTILISEGGSDWQHPGFVHVYVPDADAVYAKALEAGAQPMMPVEDQFYGDRAGGVTDPCGNIWWIATHQRAMSDAELAEAAATEEAKRPG